MSTQFLRAPDLVRIATDAHPALRLAVADAKGWTAAGVEVDVGLRGEVLRVGAVAGTGGLRWIQLRWQGSFPAGTRYLGDAWERSYGDLEWRGLVPNRVLPWYFLAHSGDGTRGLGVMTGGGAMASWMVDPAGVSLWLDCRCGGSGVESGRRRLELAAIVARNGKAGESPFQAARAFCAQLCPNPRLPAGPVYGGNNWYHAYGISSHAEILAEGEQIAALAPPSGPRPFMMIDAGWEVARTHDYLGGPWHAGNRNFPDMPGLVAGLKQRGVRPAIWFRPLLTTEVVAESWRLRAPRRHGWVDHGYFLDPSVPAVAERIREDMRRFLGWGCEMIKHDFSAYDMLGFWGSGLGGTYVADGWAFADRTRTTAEITRDFYRLLRQEAGDALLIGCNTIGHLSAGLFEIHRAGDDSSGKVWDRTRRVNINALAFRLCQHGTFHALDADCLPLTEHIPWEYSRQWLDLLARSGTPLFVSAPAGSLRPEQKAALRDAFARVVAGAPPLEPVGWLDQTTPGVWRSGGVEQWYDWTGNEGSPQPPFWTYSDAPPA